MIKNYNYPDGWFLDGWFQATTVGGAERSPFRSARLAPFAPLRLAWDRTRGARREIATVRRGPGQFHAGSGVFTGSSGR
jgi:hypothetical protein